MYFVKTEVYFEKEIRLYELRSLEWWFSKCSLRFWREDIYLQLKQNTGMTESWVNTYYCMPQTRMNLK